MALTKSDILLTETQVSLALNIPRPTLRSHRHREIGLPWIKIGGRVFYREKAITTFLKDAEHRPGK